MGGLSNLTHAMHLPHSIDNWIDGRARPAASGARMDVLDPATGHLYATMAASGAEDVATAQRAAAKALPHWAAEPPEERAAALRAQL